MQSLRDVLQNLRPQLSPIRRLRNSSLGGHLLVQRNAPGLVIRDSCSFVKLFYSTKRIVTSLMGLGFTESEWSRVSSMIKVVFRCYDLRYLCEVLAKWLGGPRRSAGRMAQ